MRVVSNGHRPSIVGGVSVSAHATRSYAGKVDSPLASTSPCRHLPGSALPDPVGACAPGGQNRLTPGKSTGAFGQC